MAQGVRALHGPIRVYVIDSDRDEAGDKVILDELHDYAEALGTSGFEMLPCTVRGRPFNIVRRCWTTASMPVTAESSDGGASARGNCLFLGYDEEEGHIGLGMDDVMHLDSCASMTVTFGRSIRTRYMMRDVNVMEVEESVGEGEE